MPTWMSCITSQFSKVIPVLLLSAAGLAAQSHTAAEDLIRVKTQQEEPEEKRLPNGKLQMDEVLKAEHAANLKDLAELQRLAAGIEAELKKNDRHVLSVKVLKELEEMEKMVKRVRGRMKRN